MPIYKIPFLDLRIVDSDKRSSIISAIEQIMTHGRFVLGPEVLELETRIAQYTQRKYSVGVNSGTDALYLGLKSLGIGPGDEVITTSLSWIATANSITLTGATPVFADIKEDLNIDPESILRLINNKTKALIPVHYTGKICNMNKLIEIAQQYQLYIIEDGSQSFGAKYYDKPAGFFGDIACFSMNPMKILAACGEAGIVVCDRDDLYERLVSLRYNGTINRETCIEPSLNGRLDTIQAAILLTRLPCIEAIIARRREIAALYSSLLKNIVDVPVEKEGQYDVYYTYTIKAQNRNGLIKHLENNGIETKIQHPILMPEQPAYAAGKSKAEFTRAKQLKEQILCIPAHEKMTDNEVETVASSIIDFYRM